MGHIMFTQPYFRCNEKLVDSQIAQSNLHLEEDAEVSLRAWHAEEKIWKFSKMGYVWSIYCRQLAQPSTAYHTPRMAQ